MFRVPQIQTWQYLNEIKNQGNWITSAMLNTEQMSWCSAAEMPWTPNLRENRQRTLPRRSFLSSQC